MEFDVGEQHVELKRQQSIFGLVHELQDRLPVDREGWRRMFWVEAGLLQMKHDLIDPPAIDGDQHVGVTRVAGVVPCGEREAANQRHG